MKGGGLWSHCQGVVTCRTCITDLFIYSFGYPFLKAVNDVRARAYPDPHLGTHHCNRAYGDSQRS